MVRTSDTIKVGDILGLDPATRGSNGRRAALYFGTKQLCPETTLAQLELGKDATLRIKVGELRGGVGGLTRVSLTDSNPDTSNDPAQS